jgi:hypothetical protein
VTRLVHVAFAREVEPGEIGFAPGVNLRTKAGREVEVLAQIRDHGGFTVFWATANLKRAHAIERLEAAGRIRVTPRQYPWSAAEVVDNNTRGDAAREER